MKSAHFCPTPAYRTYTHSFCTFFFTNIRQGQDFSTEKKEKKETKYAK